MLETTDKELSILGLTGAQTRGSAQCESAFRAWQLLDQSSLIESVIFGTTEKRINIGTLRGGKIFIN
ncbi:uncharacterized protein PHALS_13356 [Plasmopara halstedii]|uniref:Uncharacterized protein n=1 Tax=Plasmopara halstedii TaxID=4781 RepID=A0A0P1APX9_PLAHL|nr:uncharacterized protein PHALS_13356 [Plasmopara halstedii]CEG43140.1 hypothetical protein PHALS_13356 [Plasmopara halstedii]|eukprot:XP_024579509.1 hypothetical protein PHALS_13356 [Plasmopara halstedii]